MSSSFFMYNKTFETHILPLQPHDHVQMLLHVVVNDFLEAFVLGLPTACEVSKTEN